MCAQKYSHLQKNEKNVNRYRFKKSVGAVNGMEGMTAPESVAIAITKKPMSTKKTSEEVVE